MLALGLNFAVIETEVPVVDFITATESACRNLPETRTNKKCFKVVNLVSKPKRQINANNTNIASLESMRQLSGQR